MMILGGYCIFCDVKIKCDNAGKSQLVQHSSNRKHNEATKHIIDKTQSRIMYFLGEEQEKVHCLLPKVLE